MKSILTLTLSGIVSVFLLTGCSTTKVERIDVEKTMDLSGRWNDTDSRLVANDMVTDSLSRAWVDDFQEKQGRKPVVIVGHIENKSHEHINTEVFTKDLEKNLLNSGKVKFVASRGERGQVRQERKDQQRGYTSKETMKRIGEETGADYILIGSVNSVKDEVKGRYVILYQANLELVDLENNEKAWIGQRYIKKTVKKSKYSL